MGLKGSGPRSNQLRTIVRAVDPKVQRVVGAARERGLDIDPVTFTSETRTAADAARSVGCDVSQIVKSLVFGSEKGPILFLVAGTNQLDVTKGATSAGVEKLERIDADGAKAATGYSIGATPPFGLASDLPVYMDEDLLAAEVVWAAAGRPDSVFAANPTDLAGAANATVADLKQG